ncbi:MAG: nucleoside hydrolase [Bacteroidales bacterium]|nr:nucleoside hydrolase [Bacteroidales bacterium]
MRYLILILFFFKTLYPQSKAKLIIDTDGGLDDYRALIIALKADQYQIKAIVCSDGTLFPFKTAIRVKQLLLSFNIKNVFIGVGRKTLRNKPLWRNFAESISWNYKNVTVTDSVFPNAVQVLNKIFDESENNSVTYLCLGSLNNLYETFQINPSAVNKIKKIVWYNSTDIISGTNYNFEKLSADYVIKNTSIPLYIIYNINNYEIYDETFYKYIKNICSEYSKALEWHINNLLPKQHFIFADELAALYIINQHAFTFEKHKNYNNVYIVKSINYEDVRMTYLKNLHNTYFVPVLFSSLYKDTVLYKPEYRSQLVKIMQKHGEDELIYGILTTELHGHLGIYSIIGVKMGIYALELLGCKRFQLSVISMCGKNQPLSCINDGLMIATGALPSYNNFQIDTMKSIPSAIFTYNNKKVKIKLKEDIYEIIKKEINILYNNFGYSNKYWEELAKFSIEQWVNFNRNEIFEVEYF